MRKINIILKDLSQIANSRFLTDDMKSVIMTALRYELDLATNQLSLEGVKTTGTDEKKPPK